MLGIEVIALTLMGCGTEPISASDAISLDYTLHGSLGGSSSEAGIDMGGVVRDFDSSRGLDYYIDNGEIAYRAPVIQIDVRSESKNERIQVAPYLVVEMTDIEPMPEELD